MTKIIVSDKNGSTDSSYHTLITKINSKYPIVVVSWVENFVFNDALLELTDYVIGDYCEYGYDWDLEKSGSHIWGVNSDKFPRYYNNDWIKFDNWVKANPPKLMLKRELLSKDVTDTIKPIEYPCVVTEKWQENTEEQFNNRPINVFSYWGRSNEHRLRIHGETWLHSYKKGFQICDNLFYINKYLQEEKGEKWISLWIPHYYRIDIRELLNVNSLSKLSLSWEGAGCKCFRTSESPLNSIMVMHKNNMAWSFGWDETNCILVEHGKEIEGIEATLQRTDLFQIYKAGVKNAENYRLENYIPFLEKLIEQA
jgi:hypothetical protein